MHGQEVGLVARAVADGCQWEGARIHFEYRGKRVVFLGWLSPYYPGVLLKCVLGEFAGNFVFFPCLFQLLQMSILAAKFILLLNKNVCKICPVICITLSQMS